MKVRKFEDSRTATKPSDWTNNYQLLRKASVPWNMLIVSLVDSGIKNLLRQFTQFCFSSIAFGGCKYCSTVGACDVIEIERSVTFPPYT